jgi:ribonucleoside-diphosphate reductase alpha chain
MLPTSYQQFIHLSRYARWDEEAGRRETWDETVNRYFNFFELHLADSHDLTLAHKDRTLLQDSIVGLDVMPSMRCLMTAGNALSRDHIAGYNCAYRPVDDIRAFDEILFILMCATGVGFSVERQYVNQLPAVPERLDESAIVFVVRDSKRGWAEGFRELLGLLYAGRIPTWDTSRIRPAGSRLKTMGGRASGPEPLIELFEFTVRLFQAAAGRKLTSLECHDLVCKIGECVVVGGVRRSALLSLSNLSDNRMRDAKHGEWWQLTPHRQLANISVSYTETPEVGQFMEEWQALYASKSGERGIFNREAAREQAMKSGRRKGFYANGAEPHPIDFGTNPCSEIILRPKQFCNLTTVVVRPDDQADALEDKVRKAAILGTWQSTLTNFRYITKAWKNNCEEERLLGVSMTGIMGNQWLSGCSISGLKRTGELLEHLKGVAVETNKEWAEKLGIPQSTAVTCVKPEGTASQLVGATSGISPGWSRHYIRRVRQDIKDPLTALMIEQGVPHEQDNMNSENVVFSFPMETPKGTVLRNDRTAVQQLEHWKVFQDHWCEHKPSITVYVREKEWPVVGGWVWENFDSMSGVSFLPNSEHTYKQAPYEEITANQYNVLQSKMPEMDWDALKDHEHEDNTTGGRELACVAGACEI